MHRFLLSLAALAAAAPCAASPAGDMRQWTPRPASTQPNIVIVMTDDLDLDGVAYMPRVNALLAAQGITFSRSFVDASVCCPSRASTLRGQYPHSTQVKSSSEPLGGFGKFVRTGDDTSTVATWLHAAGYRTAMIGKYLSGYDLEDSTYAHPGWDEWCATTSKHYFTYPIVANGVVVHHGTAPTDYETDVLRDHALDFVRRTAGTGPFFLYVAPFAPHSPATPAPRHAGLFSESVAPRGASFNETDVSDKPSYVRTRALLDSAAIAPLDTLYRNRVRSLQAVDELVDSLVNVLTQTSVIGETYVFFTSDNGFHIGQHRLDKGKTTPYDEDIRVPLIVRGPGVPAGAQRSHLVSNIDLAPTFAELGGAVVPSFVEGLSLAPLLTEAPLAEERWRTGLGVEYTYDSLSTSEDGSNFQAPSYGALRTTDHLFVHYSTLEEELYDLAADPNELTNIVSTSSAALVDSLRDLLSVVRFCQAGGCNIVGVPESDEFPTPSFAASLSPSVARDARFTLTIHLPRPSDVSVRLFDVHGRERFAFSPFAAHAGDNRFALDAGLLPAGVYHAEIRVGEAVARRRVCLLP